MVNVAVAGGTGGIGRTIAEVLISHPQHRAIILTRQKKHGQDEQLGVPPVQVDYSNAEFLKSVLEEHQIHTVICAFPMEGDALRTAQINLLKAAVASSKTRRFIPTSFSIPYPRDHINILPLLKDYFEAIDELKKTDLQWMIVLNGIFMDYFAMPHLKTYLERSVFVVDMEHKVAAIPGKGDMPVTFTYSFDVAKFVAAALDLAEWPEESRVVGDQMTWNKLVRLAEEARGSNFTVRYDDLEKLQKFEITELPSHPALYSSDFPKEQFQLFMSILELWTAVGVSHIPREGSLNEKFPDIKPLTVREMLAQAWKGK